MHQPPRKHVSKYHMQGIGFGNEWATTEKTLVLNKTYYTLPKIKLATLILLRKIKTKSWLISKLKQNRFFGIKINKFIWPVSLNKHRRHKKHRCHYLLRRLPQILSLGWIETWQLLVMHSVSVATLAQCANRKAVPADIVNYPAATNMHAPRT